MPSATYNRFARSKPIRTFPRIERQDFERQDLNVRRQMIRMTGVALFLCLAIGMPAQDRQDPPKVVKINDSVYMAPLGANVYLVKTPAGNVVIDTCIADR